VDGGGDGLPVITSVTAELTGGGTGRTPVPSATTTTALPTVTASPTATATPTIPPPPATATPPPPTPTTAGPPANAANSGSWTLTFEVTFNNCPFGVFVGGTVEEAYEFYEAVGEDDYLEPGEAVDA